MRRGGDWLRLSIVLLWLSSLAVSIVGVALAPSATFFLLPTRIWELATGAILALDYVPRITGPRLKEAAASIGLAMVVVPSLAYIERTPFPGLAALLPCIGTAMLLQVGRDDGTQISRLLGNRQKTAREQT